MKIKAGKFYKYVGPTKKWRVATPYKCQKVDSELRAWFYFDEPSRLLWVYENSESFVEIKQIKKKKMVDWK